MITQSTAAPGVNGIEALSGAIDQPVRHRLDILVIDDDELTRRGLEISLGHLGHLVLSADGIKSASSMLRTFDFDLLICDLRLPDGTGVDILDHLPRKSPRMPAILLTGAALEQVPVQKDASFDAYLQKPLDFGLLQRAVCKLLGRPL